MQKLKSAGSYWLSRLSRNWVVRNLEIIFAFIILSLCISLFSLMAVWLGASFAFLLDSLQSYSGTSAILVLLILALVIPIFDDILIKI